jgi:hypothetical protein
MHLHTLQYFLFSESARTPENFVPHACGYFIAFALKASATAPQAAMQHLVALIGNLQHYYHPSNEGDHTMTLAVFLHELCDGFCHRLGRERAGHLTHKNDSTALDDADVRAFVNCVKPVLSYALYSKTGRCYTALSLLSIVICLAFPTQHSLSYLPSVSYLTQTVYNLTKNRRDGDGGQHVCETPRVRVSQPHGSHDGRPLLPAVGSASALVSFI